MKTKIILEGWTGTCGYDLVVRDGIIIGCEGGEK